MISFCCSALLISGLGLTGAPALVGELSTYLAPLPVSTLTVHMPANEPTIPEQVARLLAVKKAEATEAETLGASSETAPAQPQTESDQHNQETSRENEHDRTALFADLNEYVNDQIRGYQGKNYPYLLNNDYAHYNGVTTNIYYQDQILLRAHPSGNRASHCVGITFEVFFQAMQARNKAIGITTSSFNAMSFSQLQDFMLIWYAAAGPKASSNPAYAIVKYGLGKEITSWEQAKSGDFIDFSRSNGTGHSVIFQNWIREDGVIIGLRYWSSQESTDGIGYKSEYFSPHGGILRSDFYIGRVGPVNSWGRF